jgi:trimethylamine--corrinoid protein Co-methyltransferase
MIITHPIRPSINLLNSETIRSVLAEAKDILHELGFFVENREAVQLLEAEGATLNPEKGRIYIPHELAEKALDSAPSFIALFNREGTEAIELGGDSVCFDPGSAALSVLDPETGKIRAAVTRDFVDFSKVVDQLEHIHAQSTAIICSDVPVAISDRYRLYISLLYSNKPIVTGTFSKESFAVMKDMLIAVRGSGEALRKKPLAIFDACPSPPLKWSDLTCQSLIDAARAGIPSELVSMPLTGANAPVTILGAIVQHTAENLAGVVITQCVEKGVPVIWGGSPAAFDMRKATTPMGSIDTMLIDMGYAEVGKYLNLPTHAYLGMSDAKTLDAQACLESGMGTLLAGIKGINMISGAGMLNFESAQSIQKLVIDNEICGMTYKFLRGISRRDDPIAKDLLKDLIEEEHLLTHEHTLKWFKEENYFPGNVIDRTTEGEWRSSGSMTAGDRARKQASELIAAYPGITLRNEAVCELDAMMSGDARKYGLSTLPERD